MTIDCGPQGATRLGRVQWTGNISGSDHRHMGGTAFRHLTAGTECQFVANVDSPYTLRAHTHSTIGAALIQATP